VGLGFEILKKICKILLGFIAYIFFDQGVELEIWWVVVPCS
jgi:hypothetical protein